MFQSKHTTTHLSQEPRDTVEGPQICYKVSNDNVCLNWSAFVDELMTNPNLLVNLNGFLVLFQLSGVGGYFEKALVCSTDIIITKNKSVVGQTSKYEN